MKLQSKRSLSLLLTGILTAGAMMSGCSGGTVSTAPSAPAEESANTTVSEGESTSEEGAMTLPENGGFTSVSYEPSKDKYRTFYEIFPYSFCDSNGDGIGDLKGITSKLDYLNDGDPSTTTDLGIEGIWLMPVMQSPSYHKYNVTDYLSIDKDYGTMDDFKELVSEAHKRNINVIIDLVLNHTSKTHEWYKKAVAELKEGKEDGYAQYYHFSKEQKNSKWSAVGGTKYFYECEFDTDMPDLNLTNEKVREEIQKIVDYWIDAGVDGFRLDAVMWFEESGTEGCVQDLKWLYDYAKSVKDDVYMVGECWTGFSTVRQYYASGVDSFFNFDQQGSDGDVANAIHKHNAKGFVDSLVYYQDQIEKYNPLGINTPFISNHDTGRSAGFLTTETDRRMAASMYIMAPGNPFIYYGEELAMTGSENDPAKRTGMLWSTTDSTGYVEKIPGSSNKEKPKEGVEEAQKNEDSLLNFYKRVVRLKSQNPEIARGKIAAVDLGIKEAGGYVAEYDGSKVMVIFNAGAQGVSVTVPKDDFTVNEVRGYLKADAGDSASGGGKKPSALDSLMGSKAESSAEESAANAITEFTVKGQEIQMPAYSVIVLK